MSYTQIVVAVMVGLALVISAFFKGVRDWVNAYFTGVAARIRHRRWSAGLGDTLGFLEAVEELSKAPGVERFILFEGHNGGGVPRPGHPFAVKILKGAAHVTGKKNPKEIYDSEITPDIHYFGMLSQIINQNYVIVTKSELPSNSMLADFYKEEGVETGFIGFIDIVDAKMFYVSLSKYTGAFTGQELLTIKRLLMKCRSRLATSI